MMEAYGMTIVLIWLAVEVFVLERILLGTNQSLGTGPTLCPIVSTHPKLGTPC